MMAKILIIVIKTQCVEGRSISHMEPQLSKLKYLMAQIFKS